MGTPFEFRSSYEPHPVPGQDATIGCMDDRPGDEPWLQTGGGVYGLAQDRGAAMEMVEPGRYESMDLDVHIFAGVINAALAEADVEGTMHYHCAAFEQADGAVAETLFDDSQTEKLFGIAKDIYLPLALLGDDLGWAKFKRGIQAQRKVIETRLRTRDQAEFDLFEGGGFEKAPAGLYLPPKRVELTEPEHRAGDVVINHAPGYAFNSRRAWDGGHPAYSVSVGSFGEMNQPLEKHLGAIPVGALVLASAARHAAIISVLPKPEGQDALNVHSIRHL